MVNYVARSQITPWLLVCSIGLFFILDMSLLGLNFRITKSVSEDALVINLAGRQRMLSQRMSKAIFQINTDRLSSQKEKNLIDQFNESFTLFRKTLDAFYYGGTTTDAENNKVSISRLERKEARDILFQTKQILDNISPIAPQFKDNALNIHMIMMMSNVLANSNEELLRFMNRLTVMIENNSQQKIDYLRVIQLITFCFALLNFAAVIYLFRKMHKQSRELINILDELFQSTNVALIVFSSSHKVLMCNQFACHLFEYSYRELRKMNRSSLLIGGQTEEGEYKCVTRDGKHIDVELHERIVKRNGQSLSVMTIMDISSHIERGRRDPLTGIQNRHALTQALQYQSEQVLSLGGRFACFFLDLNDFKSINDQYGHDAGDSVLKCISQRLKHSINSNDSIYRFGGDEFILLVNLSHDSNDDTPIRKTFDNLNLMMQKSIYLPNQKKIKLSISAGIAIFPDDTKNIDDLISLADQSMYRAKQKDEMNYER